MYGILAAVVLVIVFSIFGTFAYKLNHTSMIDAGDQIYAYKNAVDLFNLAREVGELYNEEGRSLKEGETASNYTEATYGADLLGQYIVQGTPGNYLITFGADGLPTKIEYNQRDEYVTYPKQ